MLFEPCNCTFILTTNVLSTMVIKLHAYFFNFVLLLKQRSKLKRLMDDTEEG